jgi:hypothetical protein
MLGRLYKYALALSVFIFFLVVPSHANADCKIESVSFVQGGQNIAGETPFYAGFGKEGSYKTLNITTSNNASCKDQKAYIAIFAKNIDTGNGINKVLDNANGQTSYPLVKTGEFGGSETYGLSVNYYTAEEGCYDNTHIDLKKYIKNSTKYTKDDFKYLSTDDKNKALYGYLFDDESYKTYYSAPTSSLSSNYGGGATQIHDYHITPHILWTAKQLIYTKFGGAVDCAYYARAKIGTPIDIGSKYDSLGKPIATFDSALDSTVGTKINYLGYMCSPPETGISTSCDDSEEWEKRTTGAYIGGAIDTGDPCTPNGTPTPGCYELLAPIPGLAGNDNTINFLGTAGGEPFALEQFFTAAINVIVGATSVAAVLALMYYGFAMMNARSAGNMRNLSKYKARLWSVFWGLGIILGSYVILNTINPELLKIAPGLGVAEFRSTGSISQADFTKLGLGPKLKKTEYDAMGDQVAAELGIDRCIMRVILSRESGGDPGAIGCDENVQKSDVPSRRAFVQSKLTYDGKTIPTGTRYSDDVFNVSRKCKPDVSKPGLGVDWRFSKGIGLTQVTVFPENYFSNQAQYFLDVQGPNGSLWSKRTTPIDYKVGANTFTPIALLNPKTNLTAGGELIKKYLQKCNGDVLGAYTAYASGQCQRPVGSFAHTEATIRTQMYNECKVGRLPE